MNEYVKGNLYYVQMSDGQWWAFPIKERKGMFSDEKVEKIENSLFYKISRFIFK